MCVVLLLRTIYYIKWLIHDVPILLCVSFRDKIPRKPNGKKLLIYVPIYLLNE